MPNRNDNQRDRQQGGMADRGRQQRQQDSQSGFRQQGGMANRGRQQNRQGRIRQHKQGRGQQH